MVFKKKVFRLKSIGIDSKLRVELDQVSIVWSNSKVKDFPLVSLKKWKIEEILILLDHNIVYRKRILRKDIVSIDIKILNRFKISLN